MVRRLLIAVVLVSAMILGPSRVSTAQDTASAYKDLVTASDYRVRVAAAIVLGRSKSRGARGALQKALRRDKHPSVRAAAAVGLGVLGDAAAVPALRAALGAEPTVNVKTQIEASIKKLRRKKPAAKVKFLVTLGKFENKSGVRDASIGGMLKDQTRAKVSQVPGVEVLADGANISEATRSRKLPGFTLDGVLLHLAKGKSGPDITYSAKVEYLIRKMPEHALSGSMSGAAKALADAKSVRGPSDLTQLQRDAVAGAIDSALRGTGTAFEAAAGK